MYCCAKKFRAAKACMLLPQNRWLVEDDIDSECVTSSLLQLALVSAPQVLTKELDSTGDDDV